jgi:hypothetical protein
MSANLLLASGRDVRAALLRAQGCSALRYSQSKEAMDYLVEQDGWTIADSGYQPASAVQSRAYYCLTADRRLFLFIDGCNTAADGQAVWDAYCGNIAGSGEVFNSYFSFRGQQLRSLVGGQSQVCQSMTVVGYSSGGPVGFWAIKYITDVFSGPLPNELISFGSPKAAERVDYNIVPVGQYSTWFLADDPVPLIPPLISTWPRIMAGLSLWQGQRLDLFRGLPGGIMVGLSGQVTPATMPPSSALLPTAQIGNWIYQTEQGIETPHAITVYVARLMLAVQALGGGQSIERASEPVPHETPTPVREIRAAIASTVQTQFTDASRQNAQPVIIPDGEAFTTQRKGKVWYVLFRGTPVAVAPRKRRAHGLANDGNAWLRRLQNEGQVYTQDLGNEIVQYLADASNPLGAFQPIMNSPQ